MGVCILRGMNPLKIPSSVSLFVPELWAHQSLKAIRPGCWYYSFGWQYCARARIGGCCRNPCHCNCFSQSWERVADSTSSSRIWRQWCSSVFENRIPATFFDRCFWLLNWRWSQACRVPHSSGFPRHPGLKAINPIFPGSLKGLKVFGSRIVALIPGKGFPIEPGLIFIPGKFEIITDPVSVCQYVS